MRKIIQYFQKAKLQINIKKYKFSIKQTKYLEFIISIKGIEVNLKKIKIIIIQQILIIIKEV